MVSNRMHSKHSEAGVSIYHGLQPMSCMTVQGHGSVGDLIVIRQGEPVPWPCGKHVHSLQQMHSLSY